MKKAKERYFGDTNTFAIRYVPGYTTENRQYYYAYCHLVLHGQIIGDENESCFLNSWLPSFEGLKDRVKSNSDSLKHPAFANRSDREIFELIIKANQSPEQYWKRYDYLPALDNQVWRNCTISIDETTDAFLLAWAKAGGSIKFLWKGRGLPCPPGHIGKFYSTMATLELVIESMESCLRTIKAEMKDYPTATPRIKKGETEFWNVITTEVKSLSEIDQRKISLAFCRLVQDDLDALGKESLQIAEKSVVKKVSIRVVESYQKRLRKRLPTGGEPHPYSVVLWALERNTPSYPPCMPPELREVTLLPSKRQRMQNLLL